MSLCSLCGQYNKLIKHVVYWRQDRFNFEQPQLIQEDLKTTLRWA